MAQAPSYKVYNPAGEYVASTKHLEDAACLMAFYGSGAQVKYKHGATLWTEGKEAQEAGESYDAAAETMHSRIPR